MLEGVKYIAIVDFTACVEKRMLQPFQRKLPQIQMRPVAHPFFEFADLQNPALPF